MKSFIIIIFSLISTYFWGQDLKYPNVINVYIKPNKSYDLIDTVYVYPYLDTTITIRENHYEYKRYQSDSLTKTMSKINPRIIKHNNSFDYIHLNPGKLYISIGNESIKINSRFIYKEGQHYIWDKLQANLYVSKGGGLGFSIETGGFRAGHSIQQISNEYLDLIREFPDTLLRYRPYAPYPFKADAFQKALNNRKVVEETLTSPPIFKDSIPIDSLQRHLWTDFHIAPSGEPHVFLTFYDELIHLKYIETIDEAGAKTFDYEEQGSSKIGLLERGFTSFTHKGQQYVILHEGDILKSTQKGFIKAGKLPTHLWDNHIVWDKEEDKVWIITREQFERYKWGDVEVMEEMVELELE